MLLTNQRERENDPRHYGGLQYKFLTTTSQHFQSCYRSPSPHFLISKSNTFNVLFTVQSFLSIHWTQSINIFLLGTKHNSSITFSHAHIHSFKPFYRRLLLSGHPNWNKKKVVSRNWNFHSQLFECVFVFQHNQTTNNFSLMIGNRSHPLYRACWAASVGIYCWNKSMDGLENWLTYVYISMNRSTATTLLL